MADQKQTPIKNFARKASASVWADFPFRSEPVGTHEGPRHSLTPS